MTGGRGGETPSTSRDSRGKAARDRSAAATTDQDRSEQPVDRHAPRPDDTASEK